MRSRSVLILMADDDEAHVAGDGRFADDQAGDQVVDLDFQLVDAGFVAQHLMGVVFVLFHQRQDAAVNGLGDERTHLLQGAVKRLQFFFEWPHLDGPLRARF